MDEQSTREPEEPDQRASDAAWSDGTSSASERPAEPGTESTTGSGDGSTTESAGAGPAATEAAGAEPAAADAAGPEPAATEATGPALGTTTAADGSAADDATSTTRVPTAGTPDVPDPDATVTVTRGSGSPYAGASTAEPEASAGSAPATAAAAGAAGSGSDGPTAGPGGATAASDPDTTVTVTRPGPGSYDPDATVTVRAGSVPEPTQVGPAGTAAWPGPPPPHGDPYGPGAWPAGTWVPPGQPPPPYGAAGAGAGWPGAPQPIRRRNGKPLAILGVVLLLAVVAGVVFLVLPPGATTAVGNAAEAARGWTGVFYRGAVRGPGGAPVTVDLTVGPNGDKTGTLTRSGGGRAEFAESGGVQALRANAAWWTGAPQGADKGRRLAGTWLRNPAPETTWLAPLPLLSPSAFADDLAPVNGPDYEDAGDQQVDGVAGRVVAAADQRVVLADDRDARLLSVVPAESSDPTGLRVGPAAPDQIAAIDQARSTVASAADYTAALYDPADVAPEVLDSPPCSTPTCVATARLTNNGGLEARGFVNITADGRLLNRYPFTLGPRANATFTANFANPSFTTGQDESVYVEARVFAK